MDYFTADTHLFHANIIKHCKRPFDTVEEMNRVLFENINKKVLPNDRLFIIGDFAWWRCNDAQLDEARSSINCKNCHLIIGNHDEPILEKLEKYFVSGKHIHEIKVQTKENNSQRVIMCHYAMRTWSQSHRRSWHLYGHSHQQLEDDITSLSFDVGVDGEGYNFSPLSVDEVAAIMARKQWVDPFIKWEKEGSLYRANSRNTPEHD